MVGNSEVLSKVHGNFFFKLKLRSHLKPLTGFNKLLFKSYPIDD